MGFFSWLFGLNKKVEPSTSTSSKRKKRGEYTFEDRRRDNLEMLIRDTSRSNITIKQVKIVVDKVDPDTCAAIKRMKKIYNVKEVPEIPLDKEKCKNCTCYYEPILPKS